MTTQSSHSMIIADGAQLRKLQGGFGFTEGPTVDREGNVFFTDQPNDRIMRWDAATGQITEWMKPCGRSNGMWFDHNGSLIACADEKNELWSISPDRSHTVLISEFNGKLMNGPNDVWIRPDGGIYITDPLYARPYWKRDPAMQQSGQHVYFLSSDRKSLKQVTFDLKVPNGIVGTPDGKTLYIGDLGSNQTFKFKIERSGDLTDKKFFCPLGSDGMIMDAEGNVYLSGKGVTAFDKNGKQIEHIPVPEDWVGHVCFGGKDRKTLLITASEGVFTLQMKVRGAF